MPSTETSRSYAVGQATGLQVGQLLTTCHEPTTVTLSSYVGKGDRFCFLVFGEI